MGCRKVGHNHKWRTSGTLIIQSCERYCDFCAENGISKKLSSASSLRGHVRSVHIRNGSYKTLEVSDRRDEERAPSEAPPEMRSRASKRAGVNRPPTPGPPKRRRQASPGSVDSGAYCGMDANVKKEKSSTSSPAESHGPSSSSKSKNRPKTAALQARSHSADPAGRTLETPLIRQEQPSKIVEGPNAPAPMCLWTWLEGAGCASSITAESAVPRQ